MASKSQKPKPTGTKENRKNGGSIKPIDPDDTDSTFECPACIDVPNVVADDEMEHILTAPTVPKRARFVEHKIIAERKKDHRHNSEYLVDSVPVWRSQHANKDKLERHNLKDWMVKKWYTGQRPEHNRTKEVDDAEYETMIVLRNDPRVDIPAILEKNSPNRNEKHENIIEGDEEDFGLVNSAENVEISQVERHVSAENREDGRRMKIMLQHILAHAQDERAWTAPFRSKQYTFASRLDESKAKYIDGTIQNANDLVLRVFDQEKAKAGSGKGKTKAIDYSGINISFEGKISNQKAEKREDRLSDSGRNMTDASDVWSPYFDVKGVTVDHIIGLDRQFRMDLVNQIIEKAPHSLQFAGQVLPLVITLVPRADIDQLLDQFNISSESEWYERRILILLYNLQKYVLNDLPYLDVMRLYVDLTNMLHRTPQASNEGSEIENEESDHDGYGRPYQQGRDSDEESDNIKEPEGYCDEPDQDEDELSKGRRSTLLLVKTTPAPGKSKNATIGAKVNATRYETTQTNASGMLTLARQPSETTKRSAKSTLEDGIRKKGRYE